MADQRFYVFSIFSTFESLHFFNMSDVQHRERTYIRNRRGRARRFQPAAQPRTQPQVSAPTPSRALAVTNVMNTIGSLREIGPIIQLLQPVAATMGKFIGAHAFYIENIRNPNPARTKESQITVATAEITALIPVWLELGSSGHMVAVTDSIRVLLHRTLKAVYFIGRKEHYEANRQVEILTPDQQIERFNSAFAGELVVVDE